MDHGDDGLLGLELRTPGEVLCGCGKWLGSGQWAVALSRGIWHLPSGIWHLAAPSTSRVVAGSGSGSRK
jgi:hypothetical protein